jgi:hypothetical protein
VKRVTLLLTVLALLGAGCGSDEEEPSPASGGQPTETPEKKDGGSGAGSTY